MHAGGRYHAPELIIGNFGRESEVPPGEVANKTDEVEAEDCTSA